MENNDLGTANDLLSMIDQQAGIGVVNTQTPEPPPEKYGEVPASQFIAALETFSNGAIKSPADIQALMAERQKVQEYQAQISEFQAKSQVSPYASPLVQKINELAASGASVTEMQKYLQYQSIDPQALSDADAYRKQMEFKYPMLTGEQITAMIDEQFNPDQVAENNPLVTAKFKVAATEARNYLQTLKVQSEQPESMQARIQQEQQLRHIQGEWGKVIDKAGNTLKGVFAEKFDDMEYSYTHQFSQEALFFAKKVALDWATTNRIPFTQEGLQAVMSVMEQQAAGHDRHNIQKNLSQDLFAKAKLSALKQTAGPPPPQIPGASVQPQPPRPGERKMVDPSNLI